MKNKEKYAKELVDIVIEEWRFALNKDEKIVSCTNIMCSDCLFNARGGCISERIAWANAEYKEPERFTEREKAFVKLFPEIKYITRDESGKLAAFSTKPIKDTDDAWWVCECDGNVLIEISSKNLLKFSAIKWEDQEPTSREDILRESDN